jgi:hypothetical protein
MAEQLRRQGKDAPERQIAGCVHAVCQMPIAFRARGNLSMVDLIEESGYSALADDITELVLEKHLRQYPELVPVWVQYSEDQRCSPAFGISGPSTDGDSARDWRVFYWDHDPAKRWDHTFPDQFTACAFFIKRNAERLESLSRRSEQPSP